MGLTAMSQAYQKEPSDENKCKLFNYFINQWFLNSGLLGGISYDINQLANRFSIAPEYIKGFMKEGLLNSRIWDKESQTQLLDGLISEQITWALEDRMEVVQQVNILKQSQNGKYTPFISSELNKALKLRLDSSNSLQNIIKGMTGGNSVNIFTQINNNENQVEDAQYVTIEEARQLLQTQQAPISEDAKLLETRYALEELPEVVATKQENVDVSKEGVSTIDKNELSRITDNYKLAIELADEDHHEMRREIEANIDPDEDDPELAVYEEEFVEPEEEPEFGKSPWLN